MGWLMSCSIYSQSELKVFQDWVTTAGTQHFFYKNVTRTDGSGNVFVAGATQSAAGDYDILLAKFNSSGLQQWVRQIDGLDHSQDFATSIQLDGSGNVYIAGAITNDTVNHFSDLVVVKYNSGGTEQWRATYDGASLNDCGTDIFVATNGTVVVTGSSYNASVNLDFVSISYSSSGVQQFVARYDHTSNMNDVPVRIIKSGSSIYISGAVQTGTATYDWAEVKYNTSGVQQAVKISTGGTTGIEEVHAMVQDASGNLYLAGMTPTLSNGYDYDIIKLDSSLNIVWEQTYDGADHLNDIANGIQVSTTGDVYVTGSSRTSGSGDDYLTLKYNSSGSLIWARTFNDSLNGNDVASAMAMDNSGKIIITGSALTDSLNNLNYYTIKYDTAGIVQWSIVFDGDKHLNDRATNIAIDTVGAIVVTGASETATGVFEYATVRYVEKDIIKPTDYNSEPPSYSFAFYENKGQILDDNDSPVPQIKYYTDKGYPTYYIQNNNFSFVFAKLDSSIASPDSAQRIDVTFHQANANAKVYPLEEQKDYISYYLAHIADGVTELHGNQRLITKDIYPNVDLEYYSNQNGIKLYFVVKPGGVPANIKPEFTGGLSFNLDGTTNTLTIHGVIGDLSFDRPTVYQLNSSNVIVPITGWTADWQTNGAANKYKFNMGSYDSTKVLVIQIDQGNTSHASAAAYKNLTWSTYYGGTNGDDKFSDVVSDNNGDVYAAVETKSSNFPTTVGITNPNAYNLIGAVKFDKSGVRKYSFYYGVNNDSQVPIIHAKLDVNSTGNVFLTGAIIRSPGATTNIPFPSSPPVGAYIDNTAGSGSDVFLAKFHNLGFPLQWATYYGGNNYDEFPDVNIDNADKIYLTYYGSTDSLKKKPGAYWDSLNHGSVIVTFNTSLQRTWATHFTGGISRGAFDKVGNFFIVGNGGGGPNFPFVDPGLPAYFDSTLVSSDIFLAKFGVSSSAIQWSTLYGGGGSDEAHSIAIDKDDNIYVTGFTQSNDFPFKYAGTGTYCDSVIGGTQDIYMLRFDADLSLKWASFFGGSAGGEQGYDVTTDPITGDVFFTGYTNNSGVTFFGSTPYYTQSYGGGGYPDAYILSFTNSIVPVWGSYIGYNNWDDGYSIVANNWNQLFLVGSTKSAQSGNFLNMDPGGGAWFVNYYFGAPGYDCHISRFTIDPTNQIGIQENYFSVGQLLVYPNPSSGLFNFKMSSKDQKVYIKIYNVVGELILMQERELNDGFTEGTIDLSKFTNGVYFITAESKTGRMSKRIIKQ